MGLAQSQVFFIAGLFAKLSVQTIAAALLWITSVVSVGATRQFVFRGIDDAAKRATFRLRHGDVMHMFGDCQKAWQHSVVRARPGRGLITQHGGDGDGTAEASSDHSESARISLVFKRSLAHERERERIEPPDPR